MPPDSTIIKEIKAANADGVKLPPQMRDRLILAALIQLYEATNENTEALRLHIESSEAQMKEQLGKHEKRIEKLESHDLVSLAVKYPKAAIAIIVIILAVWAMRVPILSWLGVPVELIP